MKSQHHFEIQCEIEPREAAQIRTLIADLDRIVQVLTCALQLKRSARGFSIDLTLCMRSSPGRWQLAGTILGAPSLRLNSGSRQSKRAPGPVKNGKTTNQVARKTTYLIRLPESSAT